MSTANSLSSRIKREVDEDTKLATLAELRRTDIITSSPLHLILSSEAPSLMLLRVCTPTTPMLSNTLSTTESGLSVPTEESSIRRDGQAPPLLCSCLDLALSLPAKDHQLDPTLHRRDDTDHCDTCLYKDGDHRHAILTQE